MTEFEDKMVRLLAFQAGVLVDIYDVVEFSRIENRVGYARKDELMRQHSEGLRKLDEAIEEILRD